MTEDQHRKYYTRAMLVLAAVTGYLYGLTHGASTTDTTDTTVS